MWGQKMKIRTDLLAFFLGILIFSHFPETIYAIEPVPKTVESANLQTVIEYSVTGDVALKVQKLNPICYEPEEMARLLSHWFSKILYLLPSPMPRMFLLQQTNNALFEPKIKPKDNILRKVQIDDVVRLVKRIEQRNVVSSISLYLQELPNGQRGIVSYISCYTTEQQTVFSWAIILQYASQNYTAKDISLIYDIMAETIKAYSAGADPDSIKNTMIVPNNAYFKIALNLIE